MCSARTMHCAVNDKMQGLVRKYTKNHIGSASFCCSSAVSVGSNRGGSGVGKVTRNSPHLPLSTGRQLALENSHSFSANTNTSCVFLHRNTFFWLDIKSVYTHTCFKMFFSQIPHITQEMGDKKKLLYGFFQF